MIINKLTLHLYERTRLFGSDTITYEPNNKLQLIMGFNGSGKTSLVGELSPLPIEKNDFGNGGYKEIDCMHNGVRYIIRSGNKHSIKRVKEDGSLEELNEVGNKRIQLSLVKELFGITPLIDKVITGKRLFTDMTAMERKNWLTEISNVDFDYPIAVYNRLSARASNLKGAINLLNAKIANRKDVDYDLENLENTALELTNNIRLISSKLLPVVAESTTEEELTKEIATKEVNIKDIELIPEDVIDGYKRHKAVTETTLIAKRVELDNIPEYNKEDLIDSITELENKVDNNFDINTPEYLNVIINTVRDLTVDMSGYKEYKSGRLIDIKKLESELDKANDELDKLHQEDKHYESLLSHKITCTNCNHEFYQGYDADRHTTVKKELEDIVKVISDLNLKLTEAKSNNENIFKYANIDSNIRKLLADYPLAMMDKYKDTEMLAMSTNELSDILNKARDMYKIVLSLESLKGTLKVINSMGEVKDKSKLSREIDLKVAELNVADVRLKQAIKHNNIATNSIALKEEVKALRAKLDSLKANREIISNNKQLEDKIYELNTELTSINSKIVKSKTELMVAREDDRSKKDYTKRLTAVNEVLTSLSPKSGLIGEAMMNDIITITEDVSSIINSIWTYKMDVLPMRVDKELNYKFPVNINGKSSDDISMLSTAQTEIVNIAFRIVSMKRLNLSSHYFVVDEFARSFDMVHAAKAFDIIDLLRREFSSVYIITQFEHVKERLVDIADVSILSKELTVVSPTDRITMT